MTSPAGTRAHRADVQLIVFNLRFRIFDPIVIVVVLRQRAKFNALLIRSARFACCVVATELGGPLGPPSERTGLPRRSKAWPARSLPPPRRVRGSSRGGHDLERTKGAGRSPRVALWDPQGVDPHPPPGQGTGSYPELHAPGPATPLCQMYPNCACEVVYRSCRRGHEKTEYSRGVRQPRCSTSTGIAQFKAWIGQIDFENLGLLHIRESRPKHS